MKLGMFGWAVALCIGAALVFPAPVHAVDGTGTLRIDAVAGWKAFEIISQGNDPAGDGFSYSLQTAFDGIGAYTPDADTLRVLLNHETSDANISEIDIDLAQFKIEIQRTINNQGLSGTSFVDSARQAYDRWSSDAGGGWTNTSSNANTTFNRFCSGQSHAANTFGANRGFVDNIYMTGEEGGTNRLFALDLANRDLYQLSGVVGNSGGGFAGLPFDPWENAALLDTGETDHVAILLSPDGGSGALQLYIGQKGKDTSGSAASDFLARNGLAYGTTYYLNSALPDNGASAGGSFDATIAGALAATKMEDVDTNPLTGTDVVLGNQNFGVFTLAFNLDFNGLDGAFDPLASTFTITEINDDAGDGDTLSNADNVDWSAAGKIYVNEDESNGEIWEMNPDGTGLTKIASVIPASEGSGILDISQLLGYAPGSVLLTSNQGSTTSSMSVLISPNATLIPEPTSLALLTLVGLAVMRRR